MVKTALNNELIIKIKRESIMLLGILLAAILILKIAYYKEGLISIAKLVLSFFWIFVIPGSLLMFYYENKIGFIRRLLFGTVLGMAVVGLLSYYLGITILDFNYHAYIIPLILIAVSITIIFLRLRKKE